MTDRLVLKGQTLGFTGDPFRVGPEAAVAHLSHAAVWIEDGLIRAVGPAEEILENVPTAPVVDYGDCLLTADFIDCHAHYPQLSMVASYGEQLLEWLEKYTFPTEGAFADNDHARAAAGFFLGQCLRNGITTSSGYATVHPGSGDAFFEAASARGLRMACGKVLMDRNAPEAVRHTAQTGYDQSKTLIERRHGIGRNIYAITPRFAPTSTPAQLEAAGALWKEYPDTLMQTHLSANPKEVAWVAELFPEAPDYFGVYDKFGLAGPGAIFGHAIHLTERERAAIRDSGSAVAHCPTSNTFMGSGLFDLEGLRDCARPVTLGLASDVAGGASLSMFATLRAAYEIAKLRGTSLHPARAWYLASAGSAAAMRCEDRVGNLAPGREADIVVIDLASTPLIVRRMAGADSLWDALFAQMILADDRAIRATYAAGRLVFEGDTKVE